MVTNRNVFIIAETGRPGCNGNSVLSFQVFYKSKLVLKLKILFKKKKKSEDRPGWLGWWSVRLVIAVSSSPTLGVWITER